MKTITITKADLNNSGALTVAEMIKEKLDSLGLHKSETITIIVKRFKF